MELIEQLNNREWAIVIWVLIALFWALSQRKIRASIWDLVKAFFYKKGLVVMTLMLLYVAAVVFLLEKAGFWRFTLLWTTLVWLFGFAVVAMINLGSTGDRGHYFRKLLTENLGVVVVVEFLTNLYAFPFWVEFTLVPLMAMLVAVSVFLEMSTENASIRKLTGFLIGLYGLSVLVYTVWMVTADLPSFLSSDNLREFAVPPMLILLFLPFLYCLAVYMAYENMSLRLRAYFFNDKELVEYGKKVIFRLCHFNLVRLGRFARWSPEELMRVSSKNDIIKVTRRFRRREKLVLRTRRLVRKHTEPG